MTSATHSSVARALKCIVIKPTWTFLLCLGLAISVLGVNATPGQAQDLPEDRGKSWSSLSEGDPSGTGLSKAERSKLDGRFERVVRKAKAGRLQSAIRKLKTRARQESSRPSGEAGRQADETPSRRLQPKRWAKASREVESLLRRSMVDVRPDARRAGGTPVYGAVVQARSPSDLRGPGITVVSAFDGFATVRATPRGLSALARLPAVSKVRSAETAELQNDRGAAEVGARALNSGAVGNTKYKGQGTLTCIIDSGIDWSHPDFVGPNGNTRIRAIWDQVDDSTSVNTPVENDPSRFRQGFNPDYGSEYLRSDIQAALDGNGSINQKDVNGHGTHVAGTAASNGRAYKQSSGTKRYRGAAPKADIIAVKLDGSSPSLLNALNGAVYCQDVAEAAGKPVVINMSLGGRFAPHDGSDPVAQALEQISRPGAAVVASSGNSGSSANPIHTQKTLPAEDSVDVGIDVTPYAPDSASSNDFYEASLWTYQPGPYKVSVYTPEKQDTLTVTVDGSQAVRDTSAFTPRGAIILESSTEGNGRYFRVLSVDAAASQPPAEGEWTVRIRHLGGSATPVHGWFLGSNLGSGQTAGSAAFAQANNRITVSVPATSRGVIAVGNYIHRTRWSTNQGLAFGQLAAAPKGVINPRSSRGPTVDGRLKPAIAAPGTFTASAFSDDASPRFGPSFVVGDGEHQMLQGTSMSAPLTAGSVALLMQVDPSLSTDEVRNLLKNTARTDAKVGEVPNPTFGAGKLNIQRALTSLLGQAAPLEVLAYDQPASLDQSTSVTIGPDSVRRAALRFTPTQEGRVAGTYLTLAPKQQGDPADELADSLRVEVWSDDGTGAPASQIGESVFVDPSALRAFSPTYVNLLGAGASVQPGEDYHIVVSPDSSGTVELLAETAGPTAGRSATFGGSSWSGTGNDLVVRAQVSGELTATDQPPAIATPIPADTVKAPGPPLQVTNLSRTVFGDPEGQPLSISAASQNPSVVEVLSEGEGTVVLGPSQAGQTQVTMTATDPGGASVTDTFEVVVEERPGGERAPAARARAIVGPAGSESASVTLGTTGALANFRDVQSGGAVEARFFPDTTGASSGGGQAFVPADSFESVSRYRWKIAQEGVAFDSASVAFALSNPGVTGIGEPDTLSVIKGTEGSDDFEALPTTYSVAGTPLDSTDDALVARGVTSFSTFRLASDDADNPLPVELAHFEATADDGAVRLRWQTASETGNARFEVQRRIGEDAQWTQVGSVQGNGTTTETRSYRFTDKNLPYEADRLDYRLRQVDTDGSAHLSKTVTVKRGIDEVQLLGTYPNPARNRATVRYALPKKQEVKIRLYDVLGREVRTVLSAEQKGRHKRRVDLSGLASGVYFLRLQADGQARTRKLTVVR